MKAELIKRMEKMLSNSKRVEENYSCIKCMDRGYIFQDNGQGGEIAIPCECLDKKQSLEKLKKCGLNDAFKKRTFDTYVVSKKYQLEAKTKAMKYCNEFKDTNASLLLCGQPGAGKTHLGVAIMLNLIDKNIGCKYEEYISMLMNLKQSVMDEENYIREEAKYTQPRVLFLDDFLKGNTTDADLKYIHKIINTRYLKSMPMIISTEKTVDQIISWDEAVGSRIVEMCKGNIIVFNNASNYRLKDVMKNNGVAYC